MTRKSLGCIDALLPLAVGISASGNEVFLGTWTLNEAKSKIAAGLAKNSTVVSTMGGDNVKVTLDGTERQGPAIP
jgi:hypothetical protein